MPAYIVAAFLLVSKNSYLAVRLPGVLYSLLNIVIIFFFLKEIFNKKTAFTGAILLTFSIWDIHMAQLGWNNVNLNPFLISGVMYFLYKGIKRNSPRDILFCGIFLGVSINLLYIAALSIIPVTVYFGYQIIYKKGFKKTKLLLLTLILSTFIVSSPTIIKICKDPHRSIGRHRSFIVTNIKNSETGNGLFYYRNQVGLIIKDFQFDSNKYLTTTLWGITIEPIIIFLLLIGLFFSFRYFYQPQFFLILISFFTMFIPLVILYRTTSIWREYGFLPTIYLLTAIGLEKTISLLRKKGEFFLVLLLIAYLISQGVYLNQYYHLNNNNNYGTTCKRIAEFIKNKIRKNNVILLPNEICQSLIKVTLWDDYRYIGYDNYQNISNCLKQYQRCVVVKILNKNNSSEFNKNNPIPLFEKRLREINAHMRKYIVQKNNHIKGIIYQLKVEPKKNIEK